MKKKIFILMMIIAVNYLSATPNFINKTFSFLRSKIWREIPHDNRQLMSNDPAVFNSSVWNWVSFPRLDVDENGEIMSRYVFGNGNNVEYFNPEPTDVTIQFNHYLDQTWSQLNHWDPADKTFIRTEGYKIKLDYTPVSNLEIKVAGERIAEDTQIILEANEEFWVGYFLEESATPQVALSDIWSDIKYVKHHDWMLYRKKQGDAMYGIIPAGWFGLEYGDMVEISTFSNQVLTWHSDSINLISYPKSQVFTYEEKADYTPIYIELSPNTETEEIGVFVDGVCKGSDYVEDGTTMIRAYLDSPARAGNSEIEFVFYDGDRGKCQLNEYQVYDKELDTMIKRKVMANEGKDFYHISTRKNAGSVPEQTSIKTKAYPNPFNPTTNISYYLPEAQKVSIDIFNIKGQKVCNLWQGEAKEGKNRVVWHGTDNNGNNVGSGVYFYRLKTKHESINQKIILMK